MSAQGKEGKGSGSQQNKNGGTDSVQVLNEHETAKRLGVSVHALRKWRFEGRGPAYVKQGVRVGYLAADLSTYLEAARVEPRR